MSDSDRPRSMTPVAKRSRERAARRRQGEVNAVAVAIGSGIRAARTRAAVVQLELGRRLGCHQSQISDWERGACACDVATLARIAGALGGSVSATLPGGFVVTVTPPLTD